MRIFLLVIVGVVIAATVAMIVIGSRTFEGTVVKDPYETGLRWDEIQRQRRESGWDVSLLSRHVRTGRTDVALSVRDRNGRPLAGAVVQVQLRGPASSGTMSTARAEERNDGNYHAVLEIPERGPWTTTITVTRDGRSVAFEDTLFVE